MKNKANKILLKSMMLLFVVAALFVVSCSSEEEVVLTPVEPLVDSRITSSYHDDENKATIFNIEYESQDPYGNPVTLSGVFLIGDEVRNKHLRGTVLYNRFTLRSGDKSPTEGDIAIPVKIAGSGMTAVIADYYGYGSTDGELHPYCLPETKAHASVDALLAVRDILQKNGYTWDDYLFNIGYSEGAQVGIGVLKLCAEQYPELKFTHTFVGGGPYDVAETYRDFVETDNAVMPLTVISTLLAYNKYYGIGAEYSEMFLEPTLSRVDNYVSQKARGQGENMATSTLSEWMTPEMIDLESDLSKGFMNAFEDADLTKGWTPRADERITLVCNELDDCVTPRNTDELMEFFESKGMNVTTNSSEKYKPGTVYVYRSSWKRVSNKLNLHETGALYFINEVLGSLCDYLDTSLWFTLDITEFF